MGVGIGILGWAHGHVGAYCRQWATMPEAKLIAGWDHDAARAAESCKSYGMAVESTAASLLARRDIDAVVIAAETVHHAGLVVKAAAAGKAIVLQKPIALTLEQADDIVDSVARHRVPFTLAWQMRVDPQNLEIKRVLDEGLLGRIFMIRRRHGLPTHVWPGFEDQWHARPELNRGMWADDAAHPIDFLYWLRGMPATVIAEIGTLHNPRVPDDNGIAIFRYPDGTFAEVACSFTCSAGENTTEIVGERGVLIQNYGDVPSANVPRSPGAAGLKWLLHGSAQWTNSSIPSPDNHGQRIAGLARPLLDFLLGMRGPIATAAEGREVLQLTLACYDAAATGRRITLI